MSNRDAASLYYGAFRDRSDFTEVPLTEDAVFVGPTGELRGAGTLRTVFAQLAKRLVRLEMRHQSVSPEQVLSFYDFDLGLPGGPVPMAERLQVEGGSIASIELLFDPCRLDPGDATS